MIILAMAGWTLYRVNQYGNTLSEIAYSETLRTIPL
jgi:hypothetical protein